MRRFYLLLNALLVFTTIIIIVYIIIKNSNNSSLAEVVGVYGTGFDTDDDARSLNPAKSSRLTGLTSTLSRGEGIVVLKNVFSPQEVALARRLIMRENRAKLAEGKNRNLSLKSWNLLTKDAIFGKIVTHPSILNLARHTLGRDVQLGSLSSNTLLPGAKGQQPHVDYPYWDLFREEQWPAKPKHFSQNFFMSLTALIMLDNFTEVNGATAYVPNSQIEPTYPWNYSLFYNKSQRITGKEGDVALFFGLLHHAAMPNNAKRARVGLLAQFLPKFVTPMEDLNGTTANVGFSGNVGREMDRLLRRPFPIVVKEKMERN